MNKLLAALFFVGTGVLGACNESPVARQPITGDHPTEPALGVAADTTTSTPPAGGAAPFVNPTKAGRVLGIQSPSPPASRTR